MSSVVRSMPNLMDLARIGVHLVTSVTKYLSTLPHPIETLEELIAVVSVVSSLLTSLYANIKRYSSILSLSAQSSFLLPLTQDVLFAYKQLDDRVNEAKRSRIFEPTEHGLVTLPKLAWTMICGGEAKAASLRNRLYVEKYRIRVLIDAVSWMALTRMPCRSQEQEKEVEALNKMLPLIAERLVGVQKDYVPRLRKLAGQEEPVEEKTATVAFGKRVEEIPTKVPVVTQESVPKPDTPTPVLWNDNPKEEPHHCDSKCSMSSRLCSSSSLTIIDDSIHECWLIRRNEPARNLTGTKTFFCGLPVCRTYTHVPESWYVKPVLSSAAEISRLLSEQTLALATSQASTTSIFPWRRPKHTRISHETYIHNQVLALPSEAQYEIQKLVESRDAACSSESINRSWSVVAFKVQNRRKISSPLSNSTETGKWWKLSSGSIHGSKAGKNSSPVEYLLVLKGETIDYEQRTMPKKHGDAWKKDDRRSRMEISPPSYSPMPISTRTTPTPIPLPARPSSPSPRSIAAAPQPQQQTSSANPTSLLRKVTLKKYMTQADAEQKMGEIETELFIREEKVEASSSNGTN